MSVRQALILGQEPGGVELARPKWAVRLIGVGLEDLGHASRALRLEQRCKLLDWGLSGGRLLGSASERFAGIFSCTNRGGVDRSGRQRRVHGGNRGDSGIRRDTEDFTGIDPMRIF